jgi:hypothetical protein
MSPSGRETASAFSRLIDRERTCFKGEKEMPRSSERNHSNRSRSSNDWGVTEMVRERPIAAAAAAAGAAAAGLFLWSRRAQISNQLSNLSDQIGEWTENMGSGNGMSDDTAGLTTSAQASTANRRGMSETGGGNASLGRTSGGAGTTSSASGRGRARQAPTT